MLLLNGVNVRSAPLHTGFRVNHTRRDVQVKHRDIGRCQPLRIAADQLRRGAVADLTSSVHGKVELVWQGSSVPGSLKALGAECHVTGDTVRAVISEARQNSALEALRREGLRLISLTPVRMSLEDYFVQQLKPSEAAVEVTS